MKNIIIASITIVTGLYIIYKSKKEYIKDPIEHQNTTEDERTN